LVVSEGKATPFINAFAPDSIFVMTGCDYDMTSDSKKILELANAIEKDLFDRYGPMLGNEELRVSLGYRSTDAFRQAIARETISIPIFSIPNRRGKYALVKDVAYWLAQLRIQSASE